MASNYPTSIDDFTNPTTTSKMDVISHSGQHSDINDAVEALQAKVGIDSSAVTTSHDYKIGSIISTVGIIKSDGTTVSAASAGTDYLAPDGDGSGLSGVVTSETDPVYLASQAANITETDITNLSNLSGTNSGDQSASDFNHDDLSSITGTVGEYNHPTDAQMTVLGNTSGSNTGDQDLSGLANKVGGGTEDNLVSLTATGDIQDSGSAPSSFATASQGSTADTAVQPGDLATVATSGSYSDLSDTPSIPTSVDDLSPSQTGENGKFLTTDGTNASWAAIPGGGDLLSTNNLSDVANTATAFSNIKQAATDAATGVVELATIAETTTGTSTTLAVTPDGLHDMTSLSGAAWFLDEDNLGTNSDTKVASQQSIKAYVDTGTTTLVNKTLDSPEYLTHLIENSYTTVGANNVMFIAHRGGMNLYPQHTMEAYRAISSGGCKAIEQDVYLLADGSLGIMHDTTIDGLTTSSGNTADQTAMSWKTLVNDDGARLGALYASKTFACPLFEEVVMEFGNKVLLVPEAKNTGSGDAILAILQKYHIAKDAVIVQAADTDELTNIIAAGYKTMVLGDSLTPATIAGLGINYIGCTYSVSEAYIQSITAAGLEAVVYTVDRQYLRDIFIGYGATGFFSNDPIYLSGTGYLRTTDPFASQTWYHGMQSSNGGRGQFTSSDRFTLPATTDTNVTDAVLQGWACPIKGNQNANSFVIDFKVNFSVLPANRWASIFVGANTDKDFKDASEGDGYHCLFRDSGVLDIYKVTGGAATNIATASTSAISTGTTYSLRLTMTPSSVKWERVGSSSATTNDTAYRGGYFHLAKQYQVTASFFDVVVS